MTFGANFEEHCVMFFSNLILLKFFTFYLSFFLSFRYCILFQLIFYRILFLCYRYCYCRFQNVFLLFHRISFPSRVSSSFLFYLPFSSLFLARSFSLISHTLPVFVIYYINITPLLLLSMGAYKETINH